MIAVIFSCSGDADANRSANIVDANSSENIFDGSVLAYHSYLIEMTPLEIYSPNDGEQMPDTLIIPPVDIKYLGKHMI